MSLTVSQAITKLNARLKFCQSGTSPAFTDNELSDMLTEGIEEYSRYRPNKTVYSLSLVQGQQDYDWPSEAISIEPFLFTDSPQPNPLFIGAAYNPEWMSSYFAHYFESPALSARNNAYLGKFLDRGLGRVEVDEVNRKFTIYPAPPESATVLLPIEKVYTKTGASPNEVYSTIPDKDVKYVLNFTEAIALRRIAPAYAVNDKKIGDRDYRGKNMSSELRARADELEQEASDAFYEPVVGRS